MTIYKALLARRKNTSKASYIAGIVMVVFGFGGLVLLVPTYITDMKYGNTGLELPTLLITIIVLIIGLILSLTSEY
jgi:VIT1/CCC1 family predicted Fe2+/Mn2+ transporter